jgi:neutral trehalase
MLGVVEQQGFMPNGLRSYYLNRSQPPLLSQASQPAT